MRKSIASNNEQQLAYLSSVNKAAGRLQTISAKEAQLIIKKTEAVAMPGKTSSEARKKVPNNVDASALYFTHLHVFYPWKKAE